MKPSREEVLKIAIDCGLIVDEDYNHIWFDLVQRFAAAIYEAGAKSERAVSDRLLEALKRIAIYDDCGCGMPCDCFSWSSMSATAKKAIAEAGAMRKEKP